MGRRLILIAACLFESTASIAATYVRPEITGAIARQEMMTALPRNKRIVVSARQSVKHRITVFTDTDCPYCRQFHLQVEEYRQAGIEVQYVFYPRAGRDSQAYARAVAVWCSEDRQSSLASALNGDTFPLRTCENPVAEHYELAVRLGLLGTPALITENGVVMYGVVPVSRLLEQLEAQRGAAKPKTGSQGKTWF